MKKEELEERFKEFHKHSTKYFNFNGTIIAGRYYYINNDVIFILDYVKIGGKCKIAPVGWGMLEDLMDVLG